MGEVRTAITIHTCDVLKQTMQGGAGFIVHMDLDEVMKVSILVRVLRHFLSGKWTERGPEGR
jgi:hypothetical protein